MAAVIKLKRGTSTPSTSDIASGEVAVDTSAQKLYINDSGTVKEIGGGGSGSGGITVADDGTTYHSGTISSFTDGGGANDNTAYGKEALKELTSGDGNTALGMRALKNTQAGHSNTAIGYYAGIDIGGSAIKNTLIGHGAGDSVSGSNNTCIGYDADPSSNSVDNEITLGNSDVTKFRVPGLNFTVKDTTATEDYVLTVDANGEAGWEAAAGGGISFDSDGNLVGGSSAGNALTSSADHNVILGYEAGNRVSNHDKNVYIGFMAGQEELGGWNVAIGSQALYNGGDGDNNVAIGNIAVGNANNGENNVGIGTSAIKGVYSASISNNVGIGYGAGTLIASNNNTLVGYQAAAALSTGENNTILGADAGDALTTGSNNLILGHDAAASAVGVDNEITLGDTNVTKFRVPGLNFVIKDTTATDNYVLTVDSNGEAGWEAAAGGTPTDITVADESSDTTCFPLFATAATGDLAPKSGSNLTFNSSTGALAATLLNGGAGDDLSLDFGSVA